MGRPLVATYFVMPDLRLTVAEWAYIAGLFDGEGCILWRQRGRPHYYPELGICNTNLEVMQWLQRRMPSGRVGPNCSTQPGRKVAYEFHLSKLSHVYAFLKRVLPYLVIKRERSALSIELIEKQLAHAKSQGRRNGLSNHPEGEDIVKRLKLMNQRGT